ncbi:MAG TPA: hypothetical protein VKV73_28490 [Chloroflexota bacterium]|nr:hypothetical protein [Chloroflexota bacterium]
MMSRDRNSALGVALVIALLLGGVLGNSSLATAQPAGPGLDPGFFPATGYRIGSPEVLSYFQHRGGVRTFGYPVSNEFPLLGQRVQLFQRQLLELAADGTVSTASILDPQILPITHMDGLTLPPADPELLGAAPVPGSDDYATQSLAFINLYVPDSWNGLPVNFQSTFINTVTCADAFGTDPCDESQLPGFDLELWGLPTSLPTTDPLNTEFVYQRFQKGIMHFSRATGVTQGLLLGDWLKRVMIGVDLSADIGADVRQSRFFAQYAPSRPLALDRPTDLPDTSLAQAFRGDTLSAAGQGLAQAEPTLPTNVAQTATAVAMTATAITGTQAALQGTQAVLQGTQTALNSTAAALTATAATIAQTPTPTPLVAQSTVPVVNIGCLGDEQLWFTPRKPNIGTHVDISVTSQRHHDARFLKLTGPIDPGPVTERVGPLGFIWTWTVVPTVEDFHQWTFYADGLRPCITSGFNAYVPLGSTATPTITPVPTNTPGTATATPTQTPVPIPVISDVIPNTGLTCGQLLTIRGNNFGSPPSSVGTGANLTITTGRAAAFGLSQQGTGSNTQFRVTLPSNGIVNATGGTTPPIGGVITVSNSGGDSLAQIAITFAAGCP